MCFKAKVSLYRKALKSHLKRTSEGQEFLRQIKERCTMLAESMEKQQEQDGGSIVSEDMQMGCLARASFPGGVKETDSENAAFDF
jgi:hypothetical protein